MPESLEPTAPDTGTALHPNCANCFALCCTASGFARSADFPVEKAAGTPCTSLDVDYSCTIHESLRGRGFRGCTVFDCFGAGQHVSQSLYDGRSWRQHPEQAAEMFAVFAIVRQLHECLWHLAAARTRTFDPESAEQATALERAIMRTVSAPPEEVLRCDVTTIHEDVRNLLMSVSLELRGGYPERADAAIRAGSDLVGKSFRDARLCGSDLRGAALIAADLSDVDLCDADLLGADLRDARLHGADLSRALFLTQMQVNAALGDGRTRLPAELARPGHWRGGGRRPR